MFRPDNLRAFCRLLRAAADPVRLRLLKCLEVRPACVCELMQATGLPQARVSRHLKDLRESGLVVDRRDAQWVEYSLVEADDGTPEACVLALVRNQLEGAPQVIEDRRRLARASRSQTHAA